jgi:transposase-like protein
MYGCVDQAEFDAQLLAGTASCEHCPGLLKPWGSARERTTRHLHGESKRRPRRVRCNTCKRTDVIILHKEVARHQDDAQVHGAAILSSAQGNGYRKVAAQLNRPVSTVRNWIRRFRAKAEDLRCFGTIWFSDVDSSPFLEPKASPLAEGLDAMAAAARALILRLGLVGKCPWELMTALTGGSIFRGPTKEPLFTSNRLPNRRR